VVPAAEQVQDTAAALTAVLVDSYNDEKWGDLGDAYAAAGDSSAAEACWAIALLRDEYDQEWLDHRPDPGVIVDFLLARSLLLEDYIVGELARTAENRGNKTASQELFRLAWALDPADPEWSDMHKGEQVPASYATPIAEARAASERRTREQSAQSAMASLRADPSYAYAWGSTGDQLLSIGDTARATLLFSMAHALDPNGGWKRYREVDRARAAEAVRALGITDDETVGRLASSSSAAGSADAAEALYALALEMDPTDPQWKMEVEQGTATTSRAWFFPFVNVLVAAGLALYGARRGRTRRAELGLEEKPKKTKAEGWKMEFPPIKEKLAAGWQLGDKPPDATGTA
jgi:tetratricopeptide (TPR) repeat protein